MPLNLTANYLESLISPGMLCFSAPLGTASQYLNGPGGVGGDGIPLPWDGRITGLRVNHSGTPRVATADIPMSKGDRIALYASYTSSENFTVTLILNGFATALEVENIQSGSNTMASLAFYFMEDLS